MVDGVVDIGSIIIRCSMYGILVFSRSLHAIDPLIIVVFFLIVPFMIECSSQVSSVVNSVIGSSPATVSRATRSAVPPDSTSSTGAWR
jgi:hypothetical protein